MYVQIVQVSCRTPFLGGNDVRIVGLVQVLVPEGSKTKACFVVGGC